MKALLLVEGASFLCLCWEQAKERNMHISIICAHT